MTRADQRDDTILAGIETASSVVTATINAPIERVDIAS